MKFNRMFIWLAMRWFFLCVILTSPGSGQSNEDTTYDISEKLSAALSYFDQGDYETAIQKLTEHTQQYVAESGIAYYYVAESHYNLALQPMTERDACIEHLNATLENLELAVENGLGEILPQKISQTRYKQGWVLFRLAELDCDPIDRLNQAYDRFEQISAGPEDINLTALGAYMSAETELRKTLFRQFDLFRSINPGEQVQIVQDIRRELEIAQSRLGRVIANPLASYQLQACARFQMESIKVIRARCYAKLDAEVYNLVRTDDMPPTAREAAVRWIQSVHFETIAKEISQAIAVEFEPNLRYAEAYTAVFRHLLTGEYLHEANVAIDAIPSSFESDDLFFQANLDHKSDIQEKRFESLAQTESSPYYRVSPVYPDALYWLGWVQYILGMPESEIQFSSYLAKTNPDECDLRTGFLREAARLQLFSLAFDKNAARPGQLKDLKEELLNFHPAVPEMIKERDLLLALVRVGLQEQNYIIFKNIEEMMELIRYMLPKAARVYGRERAQYLKYLDALFEVTQYSKLDQTKFYRGITAFLRAEIQPMDQDVVKYYMQAAEIMEELAKGNSKYKFEARYVVAHSYFNAAKHAGLASRTDELYRKAEIDFRWLINEKHSVRSLFYLAEILSRRKNYLAAKECYQSIIEVTCQKEGGEFWCDNARAGLNQVSQLGDLNAIEGLKIRDVLFPENLNTTDSEEITLEAFGDYNFIGKKQWTKSIDQLILYGLPLRQLYPGVSHVPGSRFIKYPVKDFTAGIDERIIGLKSGFVLHVILPPLSTDKQQIEVLYNSKPLSAEDDGYRVENIPLNEQGVLEIRNAACYPYKKIFRFSQPRQMTLYVLLIQKFKLSLVKHNPDIENHIMRFPRRLDRNLLFVDQRISESSDLFKAFSSELSYRDLAFSGNRILVVKDSVNYLLQYRLDGSLSGDEMDRVFPLDYPVGEFSATPEGIAIDIQGRIYITDVDRNRCFVFDSNGKFLRSLGGEVSGPDSAVFSDLLQPKRIALAEDTEGVVSHERTLFRPKLLYITDHEGLKVMDENGNLLVVVPNPEHKHGAFYDLMVTGYGVNSQIYIWNRRAREVEWYRAEPE
jgi:hypothetical protein